MFRTYSNQMTAHFEIFEPEDMPTMTREQTIECLQQVEAKIATPAQWCKEMAMMDKDEQEIPSSAVYDHHRAVCWCVGEAIIQVCAEVEDYSVMEINEIVCDSVIDLFGIDDAIKRHDMQTFVDPDHDRDALLIENVFRFNDYHHTKHEEVLQVLKHAQTAA